MSIIYLAPSAGLPQNGAGAGRAPMRVSGGVRGSGSGVVERGGAVELTVDGEEEDDDGIDDEVHLLNVLVGHGVRTQQL